MLKINPCTTNLERLDFARILVSTKCLDTINAVENILIDDKHHIIKIVEEVETGFARDVCFEEVPSDSAFEFSEHRDDLNFDEPIVDVLVQDLKEVWENSAAKQTAAHCLRHAEQQPIVNSAAHSNTPNSHVSASFDLQQKPGLLHIDPVLSAPSNGQSSSPCAHSNDIRIKAASKIQTTKATSCSNTRKSHPISGPWSTEWINDRPLGDVGVVFSHKSKEKRMKQRLKVTHNPSLISLRRIARMSLKDRQHLIRMLKKTKKKSAAPSCSIDTKNKECLDANSSTTTSGEDWKN